MVPQSQKGSEGAGDRPRGLRAGSAKGAAVSLPFMALENPGSFGHIQLCWNICEARDSLMEKQTSVSKDSLSTLGALKGCNFSRADGSCSSWPWLAWLVERSAPWRYRI